MGWVYPFVTHNLKLNLSVETLLTTFYLNFLVKIGFRLGSIGKELTFQSNEGSYYA